VDDELARGDLISVGDVAPWICAQNCPFAYAKLRREREGWAPTDRESDGGDLGLPAVEYARSVRI
jgi:hypothetical protein